VDNLKKVSIILVVVFILNICSCSFADNLSIVGEAAVLIDTDTGQILFQKNPHEKLYPASTTKIMTGILAIEEGNLDDLVTIDEEVLKNLDGNHIALEPGEQISLKDLLYAALIESANDAAIAIGKHISGNYDSFISLMNEKAKEYGALNTNFTNPNGLPDENHLTTAYDLAMIAKHAMENETFRNIVKSYTYTIQPTNIKKEARYLKSANRLLYSNNKIEVDGKVVPIKYQGATGIKTGYTHVAQQCLVSSASRGELNLICVVLKSTGTNIYSDTHKLFNYGFNDFKRTNLAFKNEFIDTFPVKDGDLPYVTGIVDKDLKMNIPIDSKNEIERKVTIPEDLRAPIKKGQVIGDIEFYLGGEKIGTSNIISTMDINKKSPTLKFLFNKWIILLVILFIVWRILAIIKKVKKKKRRKNRNHNFEAPIK
jgi:D-alanyl-D-alanine carboxypeptidase (penicillin-binding protein 5/6)